MMFQSKKSPFTAEFMTNSCDTSSSYTHARAKTRGIEKQAHDKSNVIIKRPCQENQTQCDVMK